MKIKQGGRITVAFHTRLLSCLLFLLCPVVSVLASGEYRTVEIESLRITIDSEWAVQGAPGYLPVRFDITNLGEAREIEIIGQGTRWFEATLRLRTTGGSPEIGSLDVRQTLRLKRADRLRLTMPVPLFADNENIQFQIRERGRTLQNFNFSGFRSGKSLEEAPALIVADSGSAFGIMAQSWPRHVPLSFVYAPSGRAAPAPPQLDFILDPARLPANWLSFTSMRAVFIGPKDWELLTEVQKDALRTWTASGGDLMLVDGDLKTLFASNQNRPAGIGRSDGAAQRYFFGHIHFPKSADIEAKGLAEALSAALAVVQDASQALPANRAPDWGWIAERGFRLPIPGVGGVPVRAYLSILILFSLLIGPVNYVFLWRKRRQVLLVLTVPLISALFIVLLAGYAVLSEGFGVRGRAETFTILDQTTKQAATRASVSLYAAGMTPGGGLRFPRDMAVFPIGADGRGSRGPQSLDLTESQRFSAGVIQARAPSNFEEIGFRTARERLSFSGESDGVSVVNGLGAAVTKLLYRQGDKVYTLSGRLPAGEKGILQAAPWKGPDVSLQFFSDLTQSTPLFPLKFQTVIKNQDNGSYLALLERSPFWEPGVSDVEERGSLHFVLGYVGGEP